MDITRRGILAGMLGTAVLSVLPSAKINARTINIWNVPAPEGMTYEWARSSLLGEQDWNNIIGRIENGWTFVEPSAHPSFPHEELGTVLDRGGLVLMQKPTVEVEKVRALEKAKADAAVGHRYRTAEGILRVEVPEQHLPKGVFNTLDDWSGKAGETGSVDLGEDA